MFGDMAIRDLSPKDANSSGRIIKNLRICGSGLYEYHRSEAPLMGIELPLSYSKETFKVFRSPEVLIKNKDLYARVPIITGRHVRVDTSNAKQLAVGMVGDTISYEHDPDGETYLYATGTIIAGDGIEAYHKYGELSVGYDPVVVWKPGVYKNQEYQCELTGFREINHLLICQTARGGHQCCVMDEMPDMLKQDTQVFKHINGGKAMGIFKKIFGAPAETKAMSGDARVISAMLQSIKAGADCKTQVGAVKAMVGDSADETLKGYFEDLMGDEVAKATKEDLGKAVDVVDEYCQKLFGDESKDKKEDKKEDATAEEVNKEESTGDEVHPSDCTCDKCKGQKEEAHGDSIDYEKLAALVAEKLQPKKQAGDSVVEEDNVMEQSRVAALLAGDSKDNANKVTSDSLVKEIWG